MNKVGSLCLIVALAVLAACGSGNNATSNSGGGGSSGPDFSTPQGTMTALQAAFAASDAEAVLKCYTDEYVKKDGDKMRKEMKEIVDSGGSMRIEFTDADIKIEGDKATVVTKMFFKEKKDDKEISEKETYHLVKKDGVWKVEG